MKGVNYEEGINKGIKMLNQQMRGVTKERYRLKQLKRGNELWFGDELIDSGTLEHLYNVVVHRVASTKMGYQDLSYEQFRQQPLN